MLRTMSGLPRPILRWASQATASLGATLAATLIWSAVPHPSPAPAAPELTSGGKFAARVAGQAGFDGLDTMPLPRVAPAAADAPLPADRVPPAPRDRRAVSAEAPPSPAAERTARGARAAHPSPRGEARRADQPQRVAAAATAAVSEAPRPAPEAVAEEGFLSRMLPAALPRILPAIASTARSAWTVTASAGDTLVAQVVPRLP